MSPIGMTLLLLVTLAAFAWSACHRWRLLRVAARPESRGDQVGVRLAGVLRYVFGQARMPRYPFAGVAHIVVFFGFLVLLLNSVLLWIRGYDAAFTFWGVLDVHHPWGAAYAFLRDIFSMLVILGVLAFFYNRALARLKRLTLNVEGLLILLIIFVMMGADLVYEAVEVNAPPNNGRFFAAMPFASLTAIGLRAVLPGNVQHILWHISFWTHAALVLIFLNLLPYGKHFHVLTVVPNVYFRSLQPRGRIAPITNIEEKVEQEQTLGVKTIRDFSWKDVLDFYTCTECGRCTDQCPAANTGKLLSPKHLLLACRDHLYTREAQLVGSNGNGAAADPPDVAPPGPPHGTRDHTSHDESDAAAYTIDPLVPAWINPSVLWACTTCSACEEECPVFISYIDKIVGLRQNLAMEQGVFPEQLQTMFQGLENAGNPYQYPNEQRADWAQGLDVPLMAEQPDVEYLYWVGCAASFDDRSRKIAQSFAQLLKLAGVKFAILGPEETCNGDPARRAGNEFLFQMLAQQNIETLNNYHVRKIVTACPHCYNTLKNEYPDFGGHFDVIHHTELLAELLQAGRLKPRQPVNLRIAYHDACYLGRHNHIYDPPRDILRAIPGVELVEPAQTRDRGLCCGAGGAQMWKEEEAGTTRVNHKRTQQLLDVLPTDADGTALGSACPFCKTMLTDALADTGHDAVGELDVAEILWRACASEPAAST